MIYLDSFHFPSVEDEEAFLGDYYSGDFYNEKYEHAGVNGDYPFRVLSEHRLVSLDFEPITILYGGNGCGKSTILNIIAEKLRVKRNTLYNRTIMTERYVDMCDYKINEECMELLPFYRLSDISKMMTSDDVFKAIIDKRNRNKRKLAKSIQLKEDIKSVKDWRPPKINFETGEGLEQYDNYRKYKNRKTEQIIIDEIGALQQEYSNGETGMTILAKGIEEEGLYLLDEPENSLSCAFQEQLAQLILLSAKSFNSQFIIATHAPFLLAIPGAKIYNLDTDPVTLSQWWELENMQKYFLLFNSYSEQFKKKISLI